MATLFAMGVTMSFVSRHRLEIKFMVQPTEKPVMLPVVLATGACVTFDSVPKLGLIVAVALAARVAVEIARGLLLALVLAPARRAWAEVALGMTSTGALTLAAAFTLVARSPGRTSDVVLAIAAASVLLGEAVGPALLRRAITRTGEAHAVDPDESEPLSLRPSRVASDFPEPSP
jgi:hypothetical protein